MKGEVSMRTAALLLLTIAPGCASGRAYDLGWDFAKLHGARVSAKTDVTVEVTTRLDLGGEEQDLKLPLTLSLAVDDRIAGTDSPKRGVVTTTVRIVDASAGAPIAPDPDALAKALASLDKKPTEEDRFFAEQTAREVASLKDDLEKIGITTRSILDRSGRIISQEDVTPAALKAKLGDLRALARSPDGEASSDGGKRWAPTFPATPAREGDEWTADVRDAAGPGTVARLTWRLDRVETDKRPLAVLVAEVELEGDGVTESRGEIEARVDVETGVLMSETVSCEATREMKLGAATTKLKSLFRLATTTLSLAPGRK